MSYLEQTVNADLNFWVHRLSLNDAKRDLTVVEIVYRKSMMAACLRICSVLAGRKYHTENPRKLFDVVVCGVLMCDVR